MDIRSAIHSDAQGIQTLVKSLSHFYLDGKNKALPRWLESNFDLTEMLTRIDSPQFENYICEADGKIVAYLSIKEGTHLYHLFVDEQYQGQGLSRTLWEHGKKLAKSNAFTLRSSLFAVPVYKTFGFVEDGCVLKKDGVSFQPMVLAG